MIETARNPLRRRTVPLLLLGLGLAFLLDRRVGDGAAWLFLASFVFSWWLVPYAANAARRLKAVSYPGGRSVNASVIPLLGGAAVFVPLFLSLLDTAFRDGEIKAMGVALGATVIFVLGAIDDTRGVRPLWKILAQLVAGGWLVFSGFRVEALTLPGLAPVALGVFEIPFILAWVVLVTNAFNLIDGLDGLASTVALVAAFGCVFVGAQPAAAVVLSGTCLGFLRHNLPRATIFLGDSGSMILGFALAAFTLEVPAEANVPIALALLSYPLADVSLVVLRRFIRGKPLFAADRGHLHHKLLHYLGSPALVLTAVFVLAILPILIAGAVGPGLASFGLTLLMWGCVTVAIIWAGRQDFARVFLLRKPIQRLYAVNLYARSVIHLAETEMDVRMALRHMSECMGVTLLEIGDYTLFRSREDSDAYPPQSIQLPDSERASWRGRPFSRDAILTEERQSLMVERVRQAHARLLDLRLPDHSTSDVPAQPSAPETTSSQKSARA